MDVEFTTNFDDRGAYRVNVVQCRPLQVRVTGAVSEAPERVDREDVILEARGALVGQSCLCEIDRIIYVVPSAYADLSLSDRYSVARLVGRLTHRDARGARSVLLAGPGRWGTSTPFLGVPVRFGEISGVSVLCEIVAMRENLVPDVSLGTHFFNELVEADILYFAVFPEKDGNAVNPAILEGMPNQLGAVVPAEAKWSPVVRVIDAEGAPFALYANAPAQTVVCYRSKRGAS